MEEYLHHVIVTLEGLVGDYVVIGTECRISGTTITLTLETHLARVGAPPLWYLANRLQLPAIPEDSVVSLSMADHNIQLRPPTAS